MLSQLSYTTKFLRYSNLMTNIATTLIKRLVPSGMGPYNLSREGGGLRASLKAHLGYPQFFRALQTSAFFLSYPPANKIGIAQTLLHRAMKHAGTVPVWLTWLHEYFGNVNKVATKI